VGSTVSAGSVQPDLVPTFASARDLEAAYSPQDLAVVVAGRIFRLLSEVSALQAAARRGQLAEVLVHEAG